MLMIVWHIIELSKFCDEHNTIKRNTRSMAKCTNCESRNVTVTTAHSATLKTFNNSCGDCGEEWCREVASYSNPSNLSEDTLRDFNEAIQGERDYHPDN